MKWANAEAGMGAGGEGSGFEGPGLDGVVGEEPCAIEVGVVGELGDDGAGGDEEAALEHAAYHGLAATGAAGHLEGGGEAAAFDELDVVAGEVRGETVDVLEGDAAFIGDDGDGEIGGLAVEIGGEGLLNEIEIERREIGRKFREVNIGPGAICVDGEQGAGQR